MKIDVLQKRTVDVKKIDVMTGVRYSEDSNVDGVEDVHGKLMPFLEGEFWKPVIDIESGVVENWPIGTKAEVNYKVCDHFSSNLVLEDGEIIPCEESYVPDIMCPKGDGYGDYIVMDIDENGKIGNWRVNEDLLKEVIGGNEE